MNASITEKGYILINVPQSKRNTTVNSTDVLVSITDVLKKAGGGAILPVPGPGEVLVGAQPPEEGYVVIPVGTENQVLTMVGGVPVWADNDGAGIGEAPSDGTPYSRQDATWVAAGGGGQTLYDGVDTEANILAFDPNLYIGQVWWANDTKKDLRVVTDELAGVHWQVFAPYTYKSGRGTWAAPNTADGHSLDLGQETFFVARNESGIAVTGLDPKVFGVSGVDAVDPTIKEGILLVAGQISEGSVFGINTVDADILGLTKVTTGGTISGVNTSAWGQNDILYVDPTTAGGLTNVKPVDDAWVAAVVFKVDAVDGILEVLASKSLDQSPSIIPAGFSTEFFSGDLSATPPFYDAIRDGVGTVATASQTILVPDSSIVGIPIDHISAVLVAAQQIRTGNIIGSVEFSVDNTASTKRIYVEVYHADPVGVPIDTVNTLPVGDLGVRPIVVLSSGLTDPGVGINTIEPVDGLILQTGSIPAGDRLRYHVLFEKLTNQGPDVNMTLYYGSDHRTFVSVPALLALDDLSDVEIITPADTEVLTYVAASQSWKNLPAAGGAPGGADNYVQFNNAGAFGGDAGLQWDGETLFVATDFNGAAEAGTGTQFWAGLAGLPRVSLSTKQYNGTITAYDSGNQARVFFSAQSGSSSFILDKFGIGEITPPLNFAIKNGSALNDTAVQSQTFHTDRQDVYSGIGTHRGGDSTAIGLSFWTHNGGTSSSKMTLAPNGYLGIGTEVPTEKLHARGNILIEAVDDLATSESSLIIVANGFTPPEKYRARIRSGNSVGRASFIFETALTDGGSDYTEHMRINGANGYVGIGVIPSSILTIRQLADTGDDGFIITNAADTGTCRLYVAASNNSVINAQEGAFFIQSLGVNVADFSASGLNITGGITSSAVVTGTNFQLSSDARGKTIDRVIGKSDIEFIEFHRADGIKRYGVSAQQVEKVAPELIGGTKDAKTVSYIDLLVREVARLNERLSKLEE